ncbi:hypothetical protein B0J14DRAFT_687781 [Halenospora varia]|nr:hypothetical protein B0J14DRAFT_687781 [Halenospora varia]
MQIQNARLQGAQGTLQAEKRQMEERISSLQMDNKMFQGTDTRPECQQEVQTAAKHIINTANYLGSTALKLTKAKGAENPQNTPLNGPQNGPGLMSSMFSPESRGTTIHLQRTPKPTPQQAAEKRREAKRQKRLILTKTTLEGFNEIDSLDLRNKINQEIKARTHLGPVVSTVTRSLQKNLIITTTDDFKAETLLVT